MPQQVSQQQIPLKRRTYDKVSPKSRKKLIKYVFLYEIQIKQAAEYLSINYSRAKSITRNYQITRIRKQINLKDFQSLKSCGFRKIKKNDRETTLRVQKAGKVNWISQKVQLNRIKKITRKI